MKFNNFFTPCLVMKVIDILGDDSGDKMPLFHPGEDFVGGIGSGGLHVFEKCFVDDWPANLCVVLEIGDFKVSCVYL